MICLVSCIIWASGIGNYDYCKEPVTKIYETQDFYYVKVNVSKTETMGSIKIEMNGLTQQIEKVKCN